MSQIQNLIKKHCPNGVEFKRLGEIGETFAGLRGKNKEHFKDGNAKYITYMNIFNNPATNLQISDFIMFLKWTVL